MKVPRWMTVPWVLYRTRSIHNEPRVFPSAYTTMAYARTAGAAATTNDVQSPAHRIACIINNLIYICINVYV